MVAWFPRSSFHVASPKRTRKIPTAVFLSQLVHDRSVGDADISTFKPIRKKKLRWREQMAQLKKVIEEQ